MFLPVSLFADEAPQLEGPIVNINTADVYEITKDLVGMDEYTAQAIVDYREKHGRFHSQKDLLNVEGVGRDDINMNKQRIYIGQTSS